MKTIRCILLQIILVASVSANPVAAGYSNNPPRHLHAVEFWEAFRNYCMQSNLEELGKDFTHFKEKDSEIRCFFAGNATFFEGDYRLEKPNEGMFAAIWMITFLEASNRDIKISIEGKNVVITGYRLVPNSNQSSRSGGYSYGNATSYSLKLTLRLFNVVNSEENKIFPELRIVDCRYDFVSNVPYKRKL